MNTNKEKISERLIKPAFIVPLSVTCFMAYIWCYMENTDGLCFIIMPVLSTLLATLLIFRPYIRGAKDLQFVKGADNRDRERQQRRQDKSANYYGSIIFVLSVVYICFIEVINYY